MGSIWWGRWGGISMRGRREEREECVLHQLGLVNHRG